MSRVPLINFDDAVTASNLNPNQTVAVFYADGRFANRAAVAARCPHAKLYGITVWGETGAGIFALDSENGDVDTNARGAFPQTEAWVVRQIELKVELICVYANLDRWVNLGLLARIEAIEKQYGVHVKKWVANYNNVAVIPSWADADQFADPGPVDHNVALANFFGAAAPSPVPTVPNHYNWFYTGPFSSKWGDLNERQIVEQYDGARQHPVKYALYLKFNLRPRLQFLANRVANQALTDRVNGQPSWGKFNRGWRYQQLIHRAQGQQVAQ